MSRVRSRVRSIVRSIVITAAVLSCQRINPEYCASHPGDVDCAGRSGLDAGMCIDNDQCMYPTPVCDIPRAMCVACNPVDVGSCGGAAPVCGADQHCHGCTADAECASQTCLPDGACADPLDVLYAAPGGSDTATCMPGDHCSLARALALIDGTKSTIRLDPAHYALTAALTLPDDLHLVGRGAVIERTAASAAAGGGVLDLAAGTSIAIDFVALDGGGGTGSGGFGIRCINAALTLREVSITGNAGPGVTGSGCALAISHADIADNQGVGVVATDGALTLARSSVHDNLGGGVAVTRARYDLTNNVISGNGDPSSLFGGVLINQISAPDGGAGHVFAFNTVAGNEAPRAAATGVLCGIIAQPLALTSSIVVDNAGAAQVDGTNCVWSYSDVFPGDLAPAAAGTGNRSVDPLFVDPVHHNFHLQVASPVRDAADPAATLAVDIDGEPRPQGAGRDMGADEIP
jgi:hypothetical protein